jgi:DNA-binding MarR family transcriptional regulator
MNRPRAFPMSAGPLPPGSDVLPFLRLLWAIDHGMQKRSKRMAVELGVTGMQRLVIRVLGQYPRLTLSELASMLHLHASTVTGVVQRLQKGGFVVRKIDAVDRRRFRVALTRKGRAIDAQGGKTVESAVQKALSVVTAEDVDAASRVLTEIGHQLSSRS